MKASVLGFRAVGLGVWNLLTDRLLESGIGCRIRGLMVEGSGCRHPKSQTLNPNLQARVPSPFNVGLGLGLDLGFSFEA